MLTVKSIVPGILARPSGPGSGRIPKPFPYGPRYDGVGWDVLGKVVIVIGDCDKKSVLLVAEVIGKLELPPEKVVFGVFVPIAPHVGEGGIVFQASDCDLCQTVQVSGCCQANVHICKTG